MLSRVSVFQTKRLKSIILGFLVVLGAMITLGSWALSSPPGSGPDDEFHLGGIWCSHGFRMQFCEKSTSPDYFKLPLTLHRNGGARTLFCYANNNKISAGCIRDLDAQAVTKLELTKRIFQAKSPRFYYLNGFFTSTNTNAAVLTMRFFQIAIFFALTGFAFYSSGERKWAVLLALFVGIVPVGLFVIPSTNPSSWAIAGVFAAAICAMNFFISTKKSHRVMAIIGVAVAFLLTQNVRSDISIMMALCVTLGLISGFFASRTNHSVKFNRAKLLRIGLLTAPLLIFIHFRIFPLDPWSLANFIFSGSFNAFSNEMPLAFLGFLGGSMQLGSVDFSPQPVVLLLMSLGFATLIAAHLRFVPPEAKIAFGFGLSLVFLLSYWFSVGAIGPSSRYSLGIYLVSLSIFSSSTVTNRRLIHFRFSKSSLVTIFLTISLGQSLSLHQSIRRYVTGTNVSGWNLNKGAEWWWTHGPSPLSIWMLGSVAFSVAFFIVLLMLNTDRAEA